MTLDIQHALASTFSPHLNSTFRLSYGSATMELALVEILDGSTARQVNFSLLFRGPLEPPLPQQIHPFEHDQIGQFDLFIVPIKRDANGLYYEAVFNRVIKTTASAHERH